MKLDKFDKVDKFGIQLLIAFTVSLAVIAVGFAASAAVGWYRKPIQCGTVQEVRDLMDVREQTALFAGVGTVRIEDSRLTLPTIVFVDLDVGSWHVVEFNLENDQACVTAVGDNLDFEVADWFYKSNDKT